MNRKLIAAGIIALIVAIVMISGCTSGPATNATMKPSPMPVVNKTMTNVSDVGIAGNNTTKMPAVNNSTMPI